ncbi:hypothetical protein [uncultured Enterovirga sp.]|uniref:hypothetical protein n=1 Tax=uncultured Enterovirga sp. TaxID=2026352 RepID=UPI0035CA23EB
MYHRLATVVALSCLASLPVRGQSLKDVEAKEAELVAAWEKTPLTVRRAVFVTEKPSLYGAYTERTSNDFKRGETLLTYIEPIGYSWKPSGKDGFAIGITLDFVVKSKAGSVLGGQEKFLTFAQASQHKLRELMVNVSLGLGNAPAGDYIVVYTLRDTASGKSAAFEQPFRLVE